MEEIAGVKKLLRREMRLRLRAQLPEERMEKSAQLVARLVETLEAGPGDLVMAFASMPTEPDLTGLWDVARERGFGMVFPRVAGDGILHALRVTDPSVQLQPGAYRILEPDPVKCEEIRTDRLHTVLVPGLAFDEEDGVCLGQGGGYFDRWAENLSPAVRRIGIAFDFQVMRHLPRALHDCRVERIVTERAVYQVSRMGGS